MAHSDPPPNIGHVLDRIERIREELLTIQRALEALEPAQKAGPDGRKEK
jgi:hypothetical protein